MSKFNVLARPNEGSGTGDAAVPMSLSKRLATAGLCGVTFSVFALTIPSFLNKSGVVDEVANPLVGAAEAQTQSNTDMAELIANWVQARTRLDNAQSMIAGLQAETEVAVKEITERAAKIGQIEADIRAGRAAKANAEDALSDAIDLLNGPRGVQERERLSQAQVSLDQSIQAAGQAKEDVKAAENQIVNVRATIEKLKQAVAASEASAAAARTVAQAAEAAQTALNTSTLAGDGSQALDSLESDFFVQARTQADNAQKSADVVKNALALTEEKLVTTTNQLTQNLKNLELANTAVEQAYAEFAAADQAVTKVESEEETVRQKLQAEVVAAEDEVNTIASNLQVSQQTLADERTALQGLSQSLESGQALSASLQSDLDTARSGFSLLDTRLRTTQRTRLEEDSVIVANLDADLNDALRTVVGVDETVPQIYNRYMMAADQIFASCSADVTPEGERLLNRMSDTVDRVTKNANENVDWVLRVEAHSDGDFFEGNDRSLQSWQLSQQRALAMVRHLIESTGVAPERMSGSGFGEFEAMDDRQKAVFANGQGFVELSLTPR